MIEQDEIVSIRDVAIKRLHTGRVTKVGNTTLVNNTSTTITDWSIDDDGWCDSQTVWLPVGGILVMEAAMRFSVNSTGYRFVSILKNGTRVAGYLTQPGSFEANIHCVYIGNVDAGDYFQVVCQQQSGTDISAKGDVGDSQWSWQLYEVA